jgi:hypothetical protein
VSFNEDMRDLAAEIGELSKATRANGWDRTAEEVVANPHSVGRGVPPEAWQRALKVALKAGMTISGLPRPIPGADPGGFAWITWQVGRPLENDHAERYVSVAVREDSLEWTMRDGEGKRTVKRGFTALLPESMDLALRDLFDCLRRTFRTESS